MMDKVRAYLLGLPRRRKRLIQVATDIVLVWLALWLAFIVRLGIDDMYNPLRVHMWLFASAPLVAIPCLSGSACTGLSCAILAMTHWSQLSRLSVFHR